MKKVCKVFLFIIATTLMCSCTLNDDSFVAQASSKQHIPIELTATGPTNPEIITGWFEDENGKYYLNKNKKLYGWNEINDKTYYFKNDGYAHTGWLEENNDKYYFNQDGVMSKGIVSINGKNYHFAFNGKYVVVVNPWNYVPDDYDTKLVKLSTSIATSDSYANEECVKSLEKMIKDANKYSGSNVCVVSAYRSIETQTRNFNNKIKYFQNQGYDYNTAYEKAAQIIAVPGTSEHHLGLAFDIVDTQDWSLEERQENYKGQKWLMENSWKYGFILRYPKNKIDITGIIYEPWHYRYVGEDLAKEIYNNGLTLEEYFSSQN